MACILLDMLRLAICIINIFYVRVCHCGSFKLNARNMPLQDGANLGIEASTTYNTCSDLPLTNPYKELFGNSTREKSRRRRRRRRSNE